MTAKRQMTVDPRMGLPLDDAGMNMVMSTNGVKKPQSCRDKGAERVSGVRLISNSVTSQYQESYLLESNLLLSTNQLDDELVC